MDVGKIQRQGQILCTSFATVRLDEESHTHVGRLGLSQVRPMRTWLDTTGPGYVTLLWQDENVVFMWTPGCGPQRSGGGRVME